MQKEKSFNEYIQEAIVKNWERYSLSDYGEKHYRYADVASNIEKMHLILEAAGVNKGDKVALCGKNSARWGMSFLATLTYGAVAVPILHEFHPEQVHQIVNHSESKLLLVDNNIWAKLNAEEMPAIKAAISLTDKELLVCRDEKIQHTNDNIEALFCAKYPKDFTPADVCYHVGEPEELALINYTSGTTSNSKGVMIPYRALWSNLIFAKDVLGDHMEAGKQILSMLPMAHMYGMAFEFIFEFCQGIHINFLTKAPSPAVLMKALADIKPALLVCVPLIIEKIVRKAVLPKVKDPKVALLLKLPFIGNIVRKKIREALCNAFGGQYYEVIMGGAGLNQEIEDILRDIKFNYTVGYGATECAPILSYEDWKLFAKGSCGKPVARMEIKIDSPDPENTPGEILARGMNVMLGYYKNPEATAQTLKDGWYHTGDLGVMDKDGNIFIKGRSKNMLLGSNGQNIYPEEIEDKLQGLPMVMECLVIQKGEKIYGLVYPDMDQAAAQGLDAEGIRNLMEENRKALNKMIPAYEQLAGIKIMEQEFEKTPKRSIKRFLYTNTEI